MSHQSRRKPLVAGRGLKAPHDHIDVERIALAAAADATGLIGRDGGRARAKERVDDVAAVGEIENGADAYVVHDNMKLLKFTPGSTGFSD